MSTSDAARRVLVEGREKRGGEIFGEPAHASRGKVQLSELRHTAVVESLPKYVWLMFFALFVFQVANFVISLVILFD